MFSIALLSFTFASALNSHALYKRQSGSGQATYYGYKEPSPTRETPGACGLNFLPPNANYFAAVNAAQYRATMSDGNPNNAGICGKCARVTCRDSKCNAGASTVVYIADMCPTCAYGDIDISRPAFADLVGGTDKADQVGRMNVDWTVVDCGGGFGPSGNSGGSGQSQGQDQKPKDAPQKQEAPKQDPPKQDAPKQDPPKQDAPKQDPPKQEAPKQEQPKQDTPKEEGPKQDSPKPEDKTQQDQKKEDQSKEQQSASAEDKSKDEVKTKAVVNLNEVTPTTVTTVSPTPAPDACTGSYTVVPADTCYAISTKNGLTLDQFKSVNGNINCDSLQVGQNVCVKSGALKICNDYTIAEGDTCYEVAKKKGISLDDFLRVNPGIQCLYLQKGQNVCFA